MVNMSELTLYKHSSKLKVSSVEMPNAPYQTAGSGLRQERPRNELNEKVTTSPQKHIELDTNLSWFCFYKKNWFRNETTTVFSFYNTFNVSN